MGKGGARGGNMQMNRRYIRLKSTSPRQLSIYFVVLVCIGIYWSGCTAPKDKSEIFSIPADSGMKIIGYVAGWRDPDIENIDASKLTHINYAFANVMDNRVVLQMPYDAPNLVRLNALKNKNPDLKILVSVGGWTWSGNFSDAALTPESRRQFAESAADLIREHNLDGIDLDWEYPGQIGAGNTYRPEDKQNFTLLLREVRNQLERMSDEEGRTGLDRYQLTVATGANEAYQQNTEMDKAQRYLDFINIMTYDFHGSWTPTTGHHTNLYESPLDTSGLSSRKAVEYHLDAGVPAEKLVLGVAFYARGWSEVSPVQNGLYQPYESDIPSVSYSMLAENFIDKNGYIRHWDDDAKAPYLWNQTKRIFYTYDDEQSLRYKTEYIKEQGLTGAMYWEHSHDVTETLLGALYDALLGNDERHAIGLK
jgi:chitinase